MHIPIIRELIDYCRIFLVACCTSVALLDYVIIHIN